MNYLCIIVIWGDMYSVCMYVAALMDYITATGLGHEFCAAIIHVHVHFIFSLALHWHNVLIIAHHTFYMQACSAIFLSPYWVLLSIWNGVSSMVT